MARRGSALALKAFLGSHFIMWRLGSTLALTAWFRSVAQSTARLLRSCRGSAQTLCSWRSSTKPLGSQRRSDRPHSSARISDCLRCCLSRTRVQRTDTRNQRRAYWRSSSFETMHLLTYLSARRTSESFGGAMALLFVAPPTEPFAGCPPSQSATATLLPHPHCLSPGCRGRPLYHAIRNATALWNQRC